jgi:hypothetical protein
MKLFQTNFVRTKEPNTGIANLAFVFADITEDKLQLSMPYYFSFPVALRPNSGKDLLIHEVSRSHSTTHRTRWYPSGRVISSSQRPLPDNTQHSQQTNIQAPGGIRSHNLSRRAATDIRIRQRGHLDRLSMLCYCATISRKDLNILLKYCSHNKYKHGDVQTLNLCWYALHSRSL